MILTDNDDVKCINDVIMTPFLIYLIISAILNIRSG